MDEVKLAKILDSLPHTPGVYLMKNSEGTIVYVGKAIDLSHRVRSYFAQGSTDTRFIARNVRRLVEDVELVITTSEKEALLLESSLIKQHTPIYNIMLRDDKSHLCLRLDRSHPWPRFEIVRRPKKDGALYFGPYTSAAAARETIKLVRRHFKIRSCTNRFMANRVRPCLQHQMHRCLGPCVLDVNPEEYQRQVEYARLFLLGRRDELLGELTERMKEAAAKYDYERAAYLRDQVRAVELTLAPQQVITPAGGDQDVIGMHRHGDQVQVAVMEVREGKLQGRQDYHFTGQEFPDGEMLSSFIVQRYDAGEMIPEEILVSRFLDDLGALAELLTERRGKKVRVSHPRRGHKVSKIEMADANARQLLETRLKEDESVSERLEVVRRRLRLPALPRRIECVDISHLGGKGAVGSVAVVVNGQVRRPLGRTFRLKVTAEGDDYGGVMEVLSRRFTRARNGEEGWEAPDLLVIDGGRGQLGVAVAVLADLDFGEQSVVSIAKERVGKEGAESDRIYLVGRKNPVPLRANVSPLMMIALARDEAHRLAVTYQRKLRSKQTRGSELDRIPGVGPRMRAAILTRLGSVKRVRGATLEELESVPGVGPKMARKIKDAL